MLIQPSIAAAVAWGLTSLLMTSLWFVQRRRGNAAIVDVAWSFATAGSGVLFASTAGGDPWRRVIVAALAGLWGARLGLHLLARVRREAEDGRYHAMRNEWGRAADTRLFVFFQVQALWAVMFALPMLAAASNDRPLGAWDAAAILIWVVAVAGETSADRQLARFKARPGTRGQVCRDGLWRYSRHPNYFFEWLHWFAYLFLAVGSPLWWMAAAGVLTMLLFLRRVTGIPVTEAQAIRSRGDAYREYQRTTNVFFPWPPKENVSDHV